MKKESLALKKHIQNKSHTCVPKYYIFQGVIRENFTSYKNFNSFS